ncbi:bactofilin family protein [Thermodesulfobium sp.]|jgi:cytoskeletal protein CcmA (bactofilin family)|uniref:Polymer-forming cytoskeletal protein n=1 Tax=Thermodesulfobium narugense TaxID=184064 RepID=A0A7C5PAD0_9BACT
MLFKVKKGSSPVSPDTILSHKNEFSGTLKGEGNVRIDSPFEGEIIIDGELFVGQDGKINANVKAKKVSVFGEIRGNIEAIDGLIIHNTGKVYGDVKVGVLFVDEGAILEGKSEMSRA